MMYPSHLHRRQSLPLLLTALWFAFLLTSADRLNYFVCYFQIFNVLEIRKRNTTAWEVCGVIEDDLAEPPAIFLTRVSSALIEPVSF